MSGDERSLEEEIWFNLFSSFRSDSTFSSLETSPFALQVTRGITIIISLSCKSSTTEGEETSIRERKVFFYLLSRKDLLCMTNNQRTGRKFSDGTSFQRRIRKETAGEQAESKRTNISFTKRMTRPYL